MPVKFENTISLYAEIDNSNSKFFDFKDGIKYDDFYITGNQWGTDNNGVHYYNVFQDKDASCLALRMRGSLASNTETTTFGDVIENLTGATIVGNFLAEPGRYECRFKYDGSVGPVIAMWLYMEDENGDNHEIDIEIGAQYSTETITDYSCVSIGTYTSLLNHTEQKIKLNKSLADGKFHTMGFDWYTNQVIFYIDNIQIGAINTNVPTIQNRLWVGGWIPNKTFLGGNPNFDESYIFIDYVSYKPFLNQPVTKYDASPGNITIISQYPQEKVSLTVPQYIFRINGKLVNKINGKLVNKINQMLVDNSEDKDVLIV